MKGSELTEQLIRALRERQVLLVLDNFEHLADGAPLVQRLLDACPRLKLLVTSRVRLALASEWLLPLDGLPCPEDDDLDRVEAFDAARLFVAAAQRVQPDLVATTEAAAIATISDRSADCPLHSNWRLHGRVCCHAPRSLKSCGKAASYCTPPTPRSPLVTRAWRSCSTSRGAC
jgi:predicted ATPase